MPLNDPRPDHTAQIAHRFKTLRSRSLLTQRQLAELIGLRRQAVSDIECRRVIPHLSTWNRFVDLEKRHEEARQLSDCLLRPFWR
jgi:DNA-binding XRE family transcriptional regulator